MSAMMLSIPAFERPPSMTNTMLDLHGDGRCRGAGHCIPMYGPASPDSVIGADHADDHQIAAGFAVSTTVRSNNLILIILNLAND